VTEDSTSRVDTAIYYNPNQTDDFTFLNLNPHSHHRLLIRRAGHAALSLQSDSGGIRERAHIA